MKKMPFRVTTTKHILKISNAHSLVIVEKAFLIFIIKE